MREQDIARFWSKVEKTEGCWYWKAGTDDKGYGVFQLDGRARKAHRIAYDLTHDTPLGERLGCHTCDTPGCVRPDHIFPGTVQDNNDDRHAKGRSRPPTNHHRGGYKLPPGSNAGERHPRAKLTQQQVDEIRGRFQKRVVTAEMLAAEYGVSKHTIWRIVEGQAWSK
jgi:hypothetical protein